MDDEEAIRNLSRQVLSRLSYEPELAKDDAEAIELYKRAMVTGEPFDAVILDLTILRHQETVRSSHLPVILLFFS